MVVEVVLAVAQAIVVEVAVVVMVAVVIVMVNVSSLISTLCNVQLTLPHFDCRDQNKF